MADKRLAELQALCDAATDGPWTAYNWTHYDGAYIKGGVRPSIGPQVDGHITTQDAVFIAAARTALPELISRVRELEGVARLFERCLDSGCALCEMPVDE